MTYSALFYCVNISRVSACTLLCPSVVLVWKCALMCSFACINMIETSGVCYDHILISGGHSGNNKKLNVSYNNNNNNKKITCFDQIFVEGRYKIFVNIIRWSKPKDIFKKKYMRDFRIVLKMRSCGQCYLLLSFTLPPLPCSCCCMLSSWCCSGRWVSSLQRNN